MDLLRTEQFEYFIDNFTITLKRFLDSKAEEVNIPEMIDGNKVEIIDSGCFAYCHNLKKITLPDSIETIGGISFLECTSLKSIEIPKSVKKIFGAAFAACKNLEEIRFEGYFCCVSQAVFSECDKLHKIIVNKNVFNVKEIKYFYDEKVTITLGTLPKSFAFIKILKETHHYLHDEMVSSWQDFMTYQKLADNIENGKARWLNINLPDINYAYEFLGMGENNIFTFGLRNIKGIKKSVTKGIIKVRKKTGRF